MSSKSVLVIGGGLAGLSSAVVLAEAGYRVLLLERRPHLGGRATSYFLPGGGHVDNCQHVTLGCCTNLENFYRRVGAADKICYFDRLYFVSPDGRRAVIEPSAFPPPLHLAPSLLTFLQLTAHDKWGIARAMWTIARSGGRPEDAAGLTMLDWLCRRQQTPAAIDRFWSVVLVSALNEELARTDARYGADVFWKGFLASRRGWLVGIPTVPLAELYDGCRAPIEQRGGDVRLRTGVREVRVAGGRVAGVLLDLGNEITADHYLFAVPHDALLELLPQNFAQREPAFANLRNLDTSPITGVHFWFDRPVMAEPYLTVLDRTTQWIFNKSLLLGGAGLSLSSSGSSLEPREGAAGQASSSSAQYLQLVISASRSLIPLSRQEIIALCRRELAEILPASRNAELVKSTVIKEAHATFSPAPGCDRWRPAQPTPIPNLFLAGDWTATAWPATMEGAVRSGYLAAEAILAADGRHQTLLQPDLPPEGLARILSSG